MIAETPARPAAPTASRLARLRRLDPGVAWALLPAVLVAYFSFNAGGFFPDSVGLAAAGLALLLALRVTLGHRPLAAVNPVVGVAAAGLAGYAAWVLLSDGWSGAPGRAVTEFSRALLYLLVLLVCATLPQRWARRRLSLQALGAVIYVVCGVGLVTRLAPSLIAPGNGALIDRLSDPLTYWNTMGLIAALGLLVVLGLTSAAREPVKVRTLAAAAAPVMVTTLYLTFSRGAFLAFLVGLLVLVVGHRGRALALGLASALPSVAICLAVAYRADGLATERAEAVVASQRHGLVAVVALTSLLAGWLRHLTIRRAEVPLDALADGLRIPAGVRRFGPAAALVALVLAGAALGAPGYLDRQVERFQESAGTPQADQRERIFSPANNGRLDHWRVALDVFARDPLRGSGAGTFQVEWNQARRIDLSVVDAHSLYLETLSDLGLVGMALLLAALGALVVGAVKALRRADPERGADRSLEATFAAMLAAWLVQAGLDWIWETPAVTIWVFALGGLVLARRVPDGGPHAPGRTTRVAAGLGCLALAVIPAAVWRSQHELRAATVAFQAAPQDCATTIDRSLASLQAIGGRPEPWELIAYCDVGQGEFALAERAARNAVARDPQNWVYAYALALVQGAAGEDPRPAARRALALNPREPTTQVAARAFDENPRRRWRELARELPLPRG